MSLAKVAVQAADLLTRSEYRDRLYSIRTDIEELIGQPLPDDHSEDTLDLQTVADHLTALIGDEEAES